ncbi:segregation and condensation protein A [Ferrimonas balearica]|uniref:segregation and condensation protein A n=1 Tax=Ferrimonas balearica TaxID=44012 RepID=UPI001C56D9E8|nr:segregation/condensation protein A [Ferrimonas balearica]MBY6017221.1 segregation/condensation protein A [Halomonas denitrificans]MBW3140279.1 segregation/condensation protein A [Ferrimonas balearica]MBW3166289.1 segregation/condensation protein A [Ferrimonas balearica]MBY5979837.1 segregation/condensation protein A [Ferrimonas balearica]MBY6093497.1 segregation/condensation protein A [Ferrimonas balearica]
MEPSPQIQQPLPLAVVRGEPVTQWPADLFIPPEALEVILESFEGPLDLLLYLIRKQKLDILDLPVVTITRQYMDYIGLMETMKFELAAEYLVMAATLAEIKSRLLLPRQLEEGEEEEDPRALLIKQLQAYEVIKNASTQLDDRPREERDFWHAKAQKAADLVPVVVPPEVSLDELLGALRSVLQRTEYFEHHHIEREVLSTRERMSRILEMLCTERFTPFQALFEPEEGRAGVVVSFLAILELTKEQLIELQQAAPGSQIHVRARA